MLKSLLLITMGLILSLNCMPTAAQHEMADVRLLLANEAWGESLEMIGAMIKHDRDNPQLWYLGAMAHRNLMRPDSSLIYLQKSAAIDPENTRTIIALAGAYAKMNQFSKAKELYAGLIERDSVKLEPYIHLASLHLNDHEPGKALEIYHRLSKRDPENYIYYKNIAICYKRLRNDPETIKFLKKAHERNEEDLSVNTMLAELYMITKNYREGLEIAERGLEIDRSNQELLFWSGFFNYALGLHLQAIVRLSHAENEGNESVRVIQYLGICYYLTDNYEKARDYLEKAVTFGLKDYKVFNYLGIIYRELDDLEASEYYFLNSLALLSPSVPAITNTYLQLIDTYKISGDNQKAVEAYMAALVYDEGNPYLHYGLAYILDTKLKKPDLALEYYLRFSEIVTMFLDRDTSDSGNTGDNSLNDLTTLLDHCNARIRRIKEEAFFRQE